MFLNMYIKKHPMKDVGQQYIYFSLFSNKKFTFFGLNLTSNNDIHIITPSCLLLSSIK